MQNYLPFFHNLLYNYRNELSNSLLNQRRRRLIIIGNELKWEGIKNPKLYGRDYKSRPAGERISRLSEITNLDERISRLSSLGFI